MWPFGKRFNYCSRLPLFLWRTATFSCVKSITVLVHTDRNTFDRTDIKKKGYMYFFPIMWDIIKTCLEADVFQMMPCSTEWWVPPYCEENKAYYVSSPTGSGFLVSNTPVTKWIILVPFHEPDSTALPDSVNRMTQSASRQRMMDGLQTRLEKTTNEATVLWPSWCNSGLFYVWAVKRMTKLGTEKYKTNK